MKRTTSVALAATAVVAVACVPPPAPGGGGTPGTEILAVAYSNLDGVDGYDETGTDVLISKLVDTNSDGVPSVGDTVQANMYPLNFDPADPGDFGSFQLTTHTVDFIDPVYDGTDHERLGVGAGGTTVEGYRTNAFFWAGIDTGTGRLETYLEGSNVTGAKVEYVDSGDPTPFNDYRIAETGSPSLPDTPVAELFESDSVDDPFLDADVNT